MKKLLFQTVVALLATFTFASRAAMALDANPSLLDVNLGGGTYTDSQAGSPQTLQPYVGPAEIGGSSDVWSTISGHSATNAALVDTAGNATNATISFSTNESFITSASSFKNTPYANLMDSYIDTYTGVTSPQTVTLNGLAAGNYNLYLYSESNQASDTTFTLGSSTLTALDPTPSAVSTFQVGVNYVEFENVAVDQTGALSFTFQAANSSESAMLNGLQLEAAAVPEPATWAMMFLGGALLLGATVRRHKV